MPPSSLNRCEVFNCPDHVSNTSKELKHFYDSGELVDVVLVAGADDVKVQAHRLILSASSSYFRAMFGSGLKETAAEEVTLGNIDGITLKLIVDFLYSGTIELESGTVERLLKAADCFQISSLIGACCEFMADEFDPCNCLGICLFAEQHNYTTLYEKSRKFIYEYFEKVCAEKEFLQLNKEQLSKFLVDTDFFETPAELVLHSVVDWIEYDRPNREQFTCSLLSHVRFNCLDPKFILERTKSICKSTECYKLIHNWLEWHLLTGSWSKFTTNQTKSKRNHKLTIGVYGQFKFQSYDPNLEKWSHEKWPHRYMRCGNRVIVVNDKLIVVGGADCGRTVEWLDLQTMEWNELPSMKEARFCPGLAELNGHLYVVGGLGGCIFLRSVEVFDFISRTWTYSEPLPCDIFDVQIAVLNSLLYVAGTNIPFLVYYNPVSCKWSESAPRDNNLVEFGMAAVGSHLYTAGIHYNGARMEILNVERYDPKNNTWMKVRSLKLTYNFVKCAALNNRLILLCKLMNAAHNITKIEEYNPETDDWKTLTPPLLGSLNYFHLFTMESNN